MGAADIPSGFSGFASSAWICPLGPVSFRPSRRRFVPCGGSLFRAYRARAGAPVGAGAVCAPDCACARASPYAGRTSPVRFSGAIFAPARTGRRGGPRECRPRLPSPYLAIDLRMSSPIENYFRILRTRSRLHRGGVAVRSEMPFDPAGYGSGATQDPVEPAAIRRKAVGRTKTGGMIYERVGACRSWRGAAKRARRNLQALAYILKSNPDVAQAFVGMLRDASIEFRALGASEADGNPDGEAATRPTIRTAGPCAALRELSNKFWVRTDRRATPCPISNHLPEDSVPLMFIVPEQRVATVWNELKDRCTKEGLEWTDALGAGAAIRARIGCKTMSVASWRYVLDRLLDAARAGGHDTIAHDPLAVTRTNTKGH